MKRLDQNRIDAIDSLEDAISVIEDADSRISEMKAKRKTLDQRISDYAGYRSQAMERISDGSLIGAQEQDAGDSPRGGGDGAQGPQDGPSPDVPNLGL